MNNHLTRPITNQKNGLTPYTIIETDSGPQISDSRVMVFDVMEAYDDGDSVAQISDTFNLTLLQVETAIAYIIQHRTRLQPQYEEALRLRAEREDYYQTLGEELRRKIAQLPMTPQRAAFHALREKNRCATEGAVGADHSQ